MTEGRSSRNTQGRSPRLITRELSILCGAEKHQRVDVQLRGEHVHGIEGEVSLSALDAGQIAGTHFEAFGEPLLSQPSRTPDVAHARTQNRLERS